MRPSDDNTGTELYECFACGSRTETESGDQCPGCGGQMRNLGRPRDL